MESMQPRGWHSRGYLPHFDSPETVQFVTFSLADSLPAHVTKALQFDGKRYRLLAWCPMPNHAHVVVAILSGNSLGEIVGGWKSFTAKQANKTIGQSGAFWHADYFDRYMRDEGHRGWSPSQPNGPGVRLDFAPHERARRPRSARAFGPLYEAQEIIASP